MRVSVTSRARYVGGAGPATPRTTSADGLERRRGARAGESCEALLLTAKARVIAPLVVLRRGARGLPAPHRARAGRARPRQLVRARFAAKAEIEPEEHTSARRLRRRGHPDRRLRRARGRAARRRARADGRPTSWSCCASAPARRPGARRSTTGSSPPKPADRAGGQLHEGLLSGPGADRAAALPRPRESRAARAHPRRVACAGDGDPLRGQDGRATPAQPATATVWLHSPTSGGKFPRAQSSTSRRRPSLPIPGGDGRAARIPARCREHCPYRCRRGRRRRVRVLRQHPARTSNRAAGGLLSALARTRPRRPPSFSS